MIFQDPISALNPVFTIADQFTTVFMRGGGARSRRPRCRSRAPRSPTVGDRRPGPRARRPIRSSSAAASTSASMIAMALVNRPDLVLVADEPGTALDVTVQAQTLELMRSLTEETRRGRAAHLATISASCAHSRSASMSCTRERSSRRPTSRRCSPAAASLYGRAVRRGAAARAAEGRPEGIPGAVPDFAIRRAAAASIRAVHWRAPVPPPAADGRSRAGTPRRLRAAMGARRDRGPDRGARREQDVPRRRWPALLALKNVSLAVARGETVAIVGESGSGKSTLGRIFLGLERPDSGEVRLDGAPIAAPLRGRAAPAAPAGAAEPALDPQSAPHDRPERRPAVLVHGLGRQARGARRVGRLLELVGLPRDAIDRYPNALSGGQRQRAALARALAAEPDMSCSTSRPRRSTCRCRRACCTCSPSCASASA